ncbi:MAG: hypothetical protein ABEH56_00670 [Salinirussus sp.]
MYDVERTDYGLRLTIAGTLDDDEAAAFRREIRTKVDRIAGEFCVFADLREMNAFPPAVAEQLTDLMEYCEQQGMTRSVDVVDSATSGLQMEQLIDRAGINERVLNASHREDWAEAAEAWVRDGTEP